MSYKAGKKQGAALASGKAKRQASFALTRQVREIVRKYDPSETKYVDITTTVSTPLALSQNTPQVLLLNAVGQGSGDNQRIGTRIKNMYLRIAFSLYQNSGATNANFRVVVFQDSQTNGSVPTAAELFDTTTVLSAFNNETRGRFRILRDYLVAVNNLNSNNDAALQKWHIPLDKLPLNQSEYTGSGTTSAALIKGGIYFLVMADQAVTASYATGSGRSGLEYHCRFCYKDA